MGYDFNTLQLHSQAKLNILKTYLESWIWKVTQNPYSRHNGCCLMIDGFAGKGEHNDEKIGSPLIMIDTAVDFFAHAAIKSLVARRIRILVIENHTKTFQELCTSINRKYGTSLCSASDTQTLPEHPGVEIILRKGRFADELEAFLNAERTLEPSICFADPSGYLHVPLPTVQGYLLQPSSELFVNFMYEEYNRFREVPQGGAARAMDMNIDDFDQFNRSLDGLSPSHKKQMITLTYANRLREHGASYVHSFDFKKSGRVKMVLFFATNNKKGLATMKRVMWDQGELGHYIFDDRKDPKQLEFAFVREISMGQHISELAERIHREFKGEGAVPRETIEDFVLVKTIYPILKRDLIYPALERLHEYGKVSVADRHRQKNGKIKWSNADIDFL